MENAELIMENAVSVDALHKYLVMLSDNSMILGHRLSELCGHGPSLETDIALTNISLDLFGQVRMYLQYAAQLKGEEVTEDTLAFLRYHNEYYNTLLVEQPNRDFAYIIARQFFYDVYHALLLQQLTNSADETIRAIAKKSLKEASYHQRFSSEWVKRLGDGTDISHEKMQAAVDYLYPYIAELCEATPLELEMQKAGIGANLETLRTAYYERVHSVLEEATLTIPDGKYTQSGGKKGMHSEHLGYILADFQYMQRAYPGMEW